MDKISGRASSMVEACSVRRNHTTVNEGSHCKILRGLAPLNDRDLMEPRSTNQNGFDERRLKGFNEVND